jgi:2,4-dienoyl-CoA reductase-like NADH-dependent reductase (Old Yellow Enzyme family)
VQILLDREAAALAERFAGIFSTETATALVHDSFDQLAATATVHTLSRGERFARNCCQERRSARFQTTKRGSGRVHGTEKVLGQPLRVGRVMLSNRIVSAPMERNYCDSEGHMTPQYADYLLERARAGVGLVFTEATYVRVDGKGRTHQLGAHNDSCVPPLADFARRMHDVGALVGCELNHGGRTAQSTVSGHRCVAPSPIPCEVAGGEMPRALETAEIHDLVTAFADAAERCVAAGVDVLSIHAGHGYLVHQFLSPLYNHRTDEFADPTLFLNLVLDAVRERVPEIALGIRFSALEGVEGGLDADMTFDLISRLRLDQVDFLDVSAGNYEAGEWIIQVGEWEQGFLRDVVARYRAFGLPIGMAGRISSPEVAAELVEEGVTDFVSLARALHADPAFATAALHPDRLRGRGYRPCIACNVCIDNLSSGQVGCSVNPAVGRGETLLPIPSLGSRSEVLIVGAGPAGLTAARELAEAGASVKLADDHDAVGGNMRLAASMTSTPDFHRFLDWSAAELDRLGVTSVLGARVDATTLGNAVVVDATGEVPLLPDVPGVRLPRVQDIRAWLDSGLPDPESCVVWGADGVGMSVADTLAARGTAVLLLGAESEIAPESGRRAKILAVPRLQSNPDVHILLGVHLVEITDDKVRVRTADGTENWLDAPGPVLVSQGSASTIRHAVAEGRRIAAETVATLRNSRG